MIAAPALEAQEAPKRETPIGVGATQETNELPTTYQQGAREATLAEKITARIGPAVLIHIPKGQKGPKIPGWQKLTLEDMTPEHHAGLAGGNVGVLLGEASGGLIS